MKVWISAIATFALLTIVSGLFGPVAALWLGTVLLAYCIGVLWGAGSEIRKHEEREQ